MGSLVQSKMISKLVSIEKAKVYDSNYVASSKYRDNEIRNEKKYTHKNYNKKLDLKILKKTTNKCLTFSCPKYPSVQKSGS